MTTIAKHDPIIQDIAEATSIEELKDLRDKIEAFLQYAKNQKLELEEQNIIAERKLRLERRMGQILLDMPKRPGGNYSELRSHDATTTPKLSDLGITKSDSSRWQLMAGLPEDAFEQYIEVKKAKREEVTTAGCVQLAKRILLESKKAEQDEQAQAAPTKPIITLASWDIWLPQQPMCDLLITDPPYATDVEDIEAFANAWLPIALSKVKTTGRAYVCIGAYPKELQAYLNVAASMPVQQILVWSYKNTLGPSPRYGYKQNWQAILYFVGEEAPPLNCPIMNEQFSVQEINAPDGRVGNRYHTWQKPDALAEQLIRHSTKQGDSVIDCFAGTGTFLLAAHRLGREAYGCDVSEHMLGIAEQRGCEVRR